MKKIGFITLGCKVNIYESNALKNELESKGYVVSEITSDCDAFVINTCSVTNQADAKSRKMIRKCQSLNPNAIICVMGCYSQVKSEEVREIDGVSIVIGTKYRNKIVELVKEYEINKKQIVMIEDSNTFTKFEDLCVIDYFSNTRAYLKIQDGCNNF